MHEVAVHTVFYRSLLACAVGNSLLVVTAWISDPFPTVGQASQGGVRHVSAGQYATWSEWTGIMSPAIRKPHVEDTVTVKRPSAPSGREYA